MRTQYRLTAPQCLATILAMSLVDCAYSQPDIRTLITREWAQYSSLDKIESIEDGMRSRGAESRALSLVGIRRLAIEDFETARARFSLSAIAPHFLDEDGEVVRQAMNAFLALSANDDTVAEIAIVNRAIQGTGPLRDLDFIRYLRPYGITSVEALIWLLELSQRPIGDTKFLAAEALLLGMDRPPPALLPEVMDLIKSPEYYCHPNLTQFLSNFGDEARQHVEELRELRMAAIDLPENVLAVLDQAIADLET